MTSRRSWPLNALQGPSRGRARRAGDLVDLTRYNKLIVALAGVAVTAVDATQGHASWQAVVIAAITAALVFLVPNASPPTRP